MSNYYNRMQLFHRMLKEKEEQELNQAYEELVRNISSSSVAHDERKDLDVKQLWHELRSYYSESQRHYHTLSHIYDLYKKFVLYQDLFPPEYHSMVLWSIFYHDIIYDPTSKTNEDDSSNIFRDRFRNILSESTIETVVGYILATKTHIAAANSTEDIVLKQFLDLDLSILAAPHERYSQYAREIRLEYSHYPDEAYQKGRLAVLHNFLGSDSATPVRLFASPVFHDLWETAARENIMWEISELTKSPRSKLIFGE